MRTPGRGVKPSSWGSAAAGPAGVACAWGAVLAAVTAYALVVPGLHTVFPVYAEAAGRFVDGAPLYPLGASGEFRYAPLFAASVVPFALLQPVIGGALWKLAGGLALLAAYRGFARRALGADETERARFLLLALPLSLISIHNGQANTWTLALVLWAVSAACEEDWRMAGLLLAAATLIKGYPLALAALLAALGAWRLLPWLGAGLAGGLALPLLFQRTAYVRAETLAWAKVLGATTQVRKAGYRSFDQLLRLSGFDPPARAVLAISVATGLLVLLLCARYAREARDRRRAAVHALFLFSAWAVVFGPAAEPATYVLLGPGLSWSLIAACGPSRPPLARGLLVTSYLLTGPLATDLLGGTVRRFLADHGSLPLGGMLFFAVVAASRGRPGGTGGGSSAADG